MQKTPPFIPTSIQSQHFYDCSFFKTAKLLPVNTPEWSIPSHLCQNKTENKLDSALVTALLGPCQVHHSHKLAKKHLLFQNFKFSGRGG